MNQPTVPTNDLLVDVTKDLAEEASQRALQLQEKAFEASALLTSDGNTRYFVVSREYYSRLFHGFVTNTTPDQVIEMLVDIAAGKELGFEKRTDIVGIFRNVFSVAFEKNGILREVTDALNRKTDAACASAMVYFDWSGEIKSLNFFDKRFEACEMGCDHLDMIFAETNKIEPNILAYASKLATLKFENGNEANPGGDGSVLIVRAEPIVSGEAVVRRPSVQLMQLCLWVGVSGQEVEALDQRIPEEIKMALISSSVTSYSVLYERERYFEKAIRQSVKGSIIKWGIEDEKPAFRQQITALKDVNRPKISHAAPCLIRDAFGLSDDSQETDDMGASIKFPWYEMTRYEMPRLDEVLASTRGLQKFEIRSLARAVFEHLDKYFWNVKEDDHRIEYYDEIPTTFIPICILAVLELDIQSSLDLVKKRIEEWKSSIPIEVGSRGLTLPAKEWSLASSLFSEFLDQIERSSLRNNGQICGGGLEIDLHVSASKKSIAFFPADPHKKLVDIIQEWSNGGDSENQKFPYFLADSCHGDPHFENIFVDASVPEDPFIVAIDPGVRNYSSEALTNILRYNPRNVDPSVQKRIVESFGLQPMQDVAKLLLSTTGGYALIMKDGYIGSFRSPNQEGSVPARYTLSLKKQSTTLPLGEGVGGVSGARLFVRSEPVTPQASQYQHTFTTEIIFHFEELVDRYLGDADELDERTAIICKNTFFVQLWALLVRHTFSIAEKLFPNKEKQADQALVFALFILDRGTSILEAGPECLAKESLTEEIKQILTLYDTMENIDEQ